MFLKLLKDLSLVVISRPGRSQELLYKHRCDELIHSLSHHFPQLTLRIHGAFKVRVRASNHKIYCYTGLGYSKSERKSKLNHRVKSYSNFASGLNFAY